MSKERISVLIVDDSQGLTTLLARAMERAGLEVRGIAHNGKEAIDKTLLLKPDVITMDLHMPIMDGYEAIRQIMAVRPTPIVVITSAQESKASFDAVRAGALEVVNKPAAMNTDAGQKSLNAIIETVKLMSAVKVITRKTIQLSSNNGAATGPVATAPVTGPLAGALKPSLPISMPLKESTQSHKVVAIASSTGGPPALNKVLSSLDSSFPLPILIVQHISVGFGVGLIEWLSSMLKLTVVEASEGALPLPGHIYIAPDNAHLLVDSFGRLKLSRALPVKGHRPSASLLFESVGQYYGANALGIILTGMGDDGTDGLQILKKERGFCIAQDEISSVVFGMPKAAIDAGLADQVLNLDEIGAYLKRLAERKIN